MSLYINTLLLNTDKVLDLTIDVYLWVSEELNTDEVRLLGQKLVALADRRATDVELVYQHNRNCSNYPTEDMYFYESYQSEFIHKFAK